MNRARSMFRLLLILLVGLATAAHAQTANNIGVQLIPETQTVAPGDTLTLAFRMQPKAGWHGYWKNPGDSGVETRVTWIVPSGIKPGPLRYPVPDRLLVSGLMNYVYEAAYAELADVKIPADLRPGTSLRLRAKLDYLACTDKICVPESADVSTTVDVASAAGPRDPAFDRFRQALPKPLGATATYERRGNLLRLGVPIPASLHVDQPYFFPLSEGVLDHAAPQTVSRNGDRLVIEVKAGRLRAPDAIAGVLKIGQGQGLSLDAAPGPVPAAGQPLAGEGNPEAPPVGILAALLGAIAGGLLLNIMPCVFPILSLKALSLARAGGEERQARNESFAYTAGVVLVCLALGGLLLALRAGGSAFGWAFQLQDPRVILFLLLLVGAIALNLAGLFELPSFGGGDRLARRGGAAGAFWTGALAAFVATPCTGPFMGVALGAALVLPPLSALAVFAGLGLGLALPFLLLGLFPPLRRWLPKPGPWMNRFRRIMSVPMFVTALGLLWILDRQSGTTGLAIGLVTLAVLFLSLWWLRRRGTGGRPWMPLVPAAAVALAAVLLLPSVAAPAAGTEQSALGAEPFSEQRLAALQAEGRPVFVYFTADWCLTCKVNEKAVLERAEVSNSFRQRKIAVLVGDWTRGDARIGRFLQKNGRSGVPLYLYFAPGKQVQVLPQILTVARLTELPAG